MQYFAHFENKSIKNNKSVEFFNKYPSNTDRYCGVEGHFSKIDSILNTHRKFLRLLFFRKVGDCGSKWGSIPGKYQARPSIDDQSGENSQKIVSRETPIPIRSRTP